MYLTLALFLIIAAIFFHELGHALAMRRYDVRIAELGIGLPFAPRIVIRNNWTKHLLGPGARMSFSPWILGAYVKEVDEGYENILTYREASHIYGAGIIANIAFGFVLLGGYELIISSERNWSGKPFWLGLFSFLAAHFVLKFGKEIAAWILPLISIALTAYIAVWITGTPTKEVVGALGGPASIVSVTSEVATNLKSALWIGGIVSLSLAGVNVLPFTPFDGGHTWREILLRFAPSLVGPFQVIGLCAALLLIGTALMNDVLLLFR